MAPGAHASLFSDKPWIDGSEVKFRAVCALGWSLLDLLPELRSLCDDLDEHWLDWVERIEQDALKPFENATQREAQTWPRDLENAIAFLSDQPLLRPFPSLAELIGRLGHLVSQREAQDPVLQLQRFNERGFALATQMVQSSLWSTDAARRRWKLTEPAASELSSDTHGHFRPVTDDGRIQLRVNTAAFSLRNALLSYLTLEFQMMHEYVSHFLPAWNSGGTLEEEYLLAAMFLFYRAERKPRDGIHGFLVDEMDRRRTDRHRARRQVILTNLAPLVGEQRLTQLLLDLASLEEQQMSGAEKRRMLALLGRVPAQDSSVETALERSLREDSLQDVFEQLSKAFPVRALDSQS